MNRPITLDANDRIVAEGKIPLSPEQVEAGYWFATLAPSHEDYRVPVGEVIIP